MRGEHRKRPWLAALLALGYPGLGHLYLREWARALLWFGVALMTASLLVPESLVPAQLSLDSLTRMTRALPPGTALTFLAVTAASVADAYWTATRVNRERRRTAAGERCPHCGEDVDPELDFCHWCTAELASGG